MSGYLLGVNPFDQPGVEAYKKNMFALLGKPGFEELKAELEERLNNKSGRIRPLLLFHRKVHQYIQTRVGMLKKKSRRDGLDSDSFKFRRTYICVI